MSGDRLSYAAFGTCALIWGSTFLVISFGNDGLPPLWALALRLLIASAILLGLMKLTGAAWPRGPQMQAVAWYGVLEYGVSFPLLYYSEKLIPSGVAALMFATCPIAAMFLGRLFGFERVTWAKAGAGMLGIIGLLIIFAKQASGGNVVGTLCALGAALSAVLASTLLKRGGTQSAFVGNGIGSLMGVPIALVISRIAGEPWSLPNTLGEIWPVLYLAVLGSVGAFTLFVWLLGRWEASTASYLGVICPVIALILGSIFKHEPISGATLAGGAVVLASVALALWLQSREATLLTEPSS